MDKKITFTGKDIESLTDNADAYAVFQRQMGEEHSVSK